MEHARRQPSPLSTTDLWHIGGAVSRIADESAAFAGRDAAFVLNVEANWRDPADDRMYLNFPGFHEGGMETMRKTYGLKLERLQAIKRKYDPENVFRLNQNIEPGG